MISKLTDFAQLVMASPENLHLNYIDVKLLGHQLIKDRRDIKTAALEFARYAFNQLTQRTQTVMSITLYESEKIADIAKARSRQLLEKIPDDANLSLNSLTYMDCVLQDDHNFSESAGITVFYRPPRFGRLKHKTTHSGWECFEFITEPNCRFFTQELQEL